MAPMTDPSRPARRRVLVLFVNSSLGLVGGALAALLGVFAVRPANGGDRGRWLRAGTLADLPPGVPVPRVLAVPRVDGWYRARVPRTVFLLRDSATGVRALSATCTHLGCQVHWDGDAKQFRCPCHGGAYAPDGAVLAGPPPRPLDSIAVRVEGSDDAVLVRL